MIRLNVLLAVVLAFAIPPAVLSNEITGEVLAPVEMPIAVNDSPDDVVAALGKPSGDIEYSNKRNFSYRFGRVIFIDGKVASFNIDMEKMKSTTDSANKVTESGGYQPKPKRDLPKRSSASKRTTGERSPPNSWAESSTKRKSSSSGSSYQRIQPRPSIAENGDYYGRDNDGDGRVETVHVRGYRRKDGTYVRGHYRAKPRR